MTNTSYAYSILNNIRYYVCILFIEYYEYQLSRTFICGYNTLQDHNFVIDFKRINNK